MQRVTFTVFGAVRASVDGNPCDVPGRRERSVLSVLLSRRGHVVPTDRLIHEVWGDHPPERARASLQVAVSRLRSVLEPARPAGTPARVLVSSGDGYRVDVPADALDSDRFADLARRAYGLAASADQDGVLALVEEAEGLWAGAPYPDPPDSEIVRAEVQRLDELRWSLAELKAAALLATGRPALAVPTLEELVGEHPFREHAWRLLALALYRGGRQADALAAVRRARERLVEELGVDPSPELRALEQDLLEQSPRLDPATPSDSVTGPTPGNPARGDALVGVVGRQRAVEELRAAVERLCAEPGRGGAVVLTGEAGIGKTTLATTTARLAENRGARTLWGRCHESEVSPAYWPWVPVVRELAGPRPEPEVAALLSSEAAALARDTQSAALRTYDAVTRLLVSAATPRPVVVVIEDLHWADSSSLELLAFAAEALRGSRVLLVVTVRVPEVAPEGLRRCLASLARASADRLHVPGLDVDEVRLLVSAVSGRSTDEQLADVVAERTDGNPFFVIELVRLLESERRLDADGARTVAVPDGVEDVLRLRLGRLAEDVHRLLAVASVCGRDFDTDLLADVAEVEPEQALERLEVALEARVVRETSDPGRFRFAHALVRETLYEGLSAVRRARIHAACGEALERLLPSHPDLVAEVAHHLVRGAAVRPELAPAAVAHAVEAAQLAEGRSAVDRARTHWEDALAADERSREPSVRRRYGVLVGLGRSRGLMGDIVGSRAALDEAVRLAEDVDDIELVAAAATSFRGAGVWHWREFGTSDPAMQQVLRECLDRLPSGPLQARVLASLAMELLYEWRSLEAEPFSQRSLEVARTAGDPALLAEVAQLRQLFLFGRPGSTTEILEIVDEVLELDLGHESELYSRFNAAFALLQQGDVDGADLQTTRCVELVRRLRHTGADVPMAWWTFYRTLLRGDHHAAAPLLERAIDRHRRSSVVGAPEIVAGGRLRLASAGSGDADEEAGAGLQELLTPELVAFAESHANPAFRAMVAGALVEAGEVARGAEILGPPVPDGAWDYASTYGHCLRVAVLAAADDRPRLVEALRRIEPWGAEFATYGSTECIGSVAYFVGRGREALGDLAGAERSYLQAVEANRRGGVVLWQARAEQRLGEVRTLRAPARP